jgi:hypothetical protein
MWSPPYAPYRIFLIFLVLSILPSRAKSGPVSETTSVAGRARASTPGNAETPANREFIDGDGCCCGAAASLQRLKQAPGPQEQLRGYLNAAAGSIPHAVNATAPLGASWHNGVAGHLAVPANLSGTEDADLQPATGSPTLNLDLPPDAIRFRQLFDSDQLVADKAVVSTYYLDLAGRLPEADIWGQRIAIDLFGSSELAFNGDQQEDAYATTKIWSDERVVTDGLAGDGSSDSGFGGASALHGRLMIALRGQDGFNGPILPGTTKTTEAPVRGLVPRILKWAYHNPLLAGLVGGAFALLIATIVSRNSAREPQKAP